MSELDVLGLDRDVKRIAESWGRWRRGLRQGGGIDWDPFALGPDVARRTTWHAVAELDPADPLRRPLERWIYRLAEQRINRQGLARIAWLRCHAPHRLNGPEPGTYTAHDLTQRLLTDSPRREAWLEALEQAGDELSRSEGLVWERRQEIANGMGLDSPDDVEGVAGADAAARRWLEVSAELLDDTSITSWEQWMSLAMGEAAGEGWPAHLTPRTMTEMLSETSWLDRVPLDPGELPAALGAASFVRALAQIGCAWGEALATSRQPFVIAHDPYGLRSAEFGALFASLPLHPAFTRRVLAVGAPRVRDHLRAMARVWLLGTRIAALRVLLRQAALAGTRALRDAYPELVRTACGLGLSSRLAAVVVRLDVDDTARFAGLLQGALRRERQVQEHDEDWFRDPRSAEALRDEADLPPPVDVPGQALDQGIDALGRLLRSIW